mmetsp:Transcript_22834/g.77778  ORF Transcript_22834/g.77778 Transcript_22834/m.77778 type:complete len:321 (+) Transcript_22834:768-1730(+)
MPARGISEAGQRRPDVGRQWVHRHQHQERPPKRPADAAAHVPAAVHRGLGRGGGGQADKDPDALAGGEAVHAEAQDRGEFGERHPGGRACEAGEPDRVLVRLHREAGQVVAAALRGLVPELAERQRPPAALVVRLEPHAPKQEEDGLFRERRPLLRKLPLALKVQAPLGQGQDTGRHALDGAGTGARAAGVHPRGRGRGRSGGRGGTFSGAERRAGGRGQGDSAPEVSVEALCWVMDAAGARGAARRRRPAAAGSAGGHTGPGRTRGRAARGLGGDARRCYRRQVLSEPCRRRVGLGWLSEVRTQTFCGVVEAAGSHTGS